MTTETPRTDALETFYATNGARWNQAQATLARALERELADAELRARSAVTMYGHKAVECVTLRAALERIERLTGSTSGPAALIEDNRTTARLALAKVQA